MQHLRCAVEMPFHLSACLALSALVFLPFLSLKVYGLGMSSNIYCLGRSSLLPQAGLDSSVLTCTA